GPRRRVLVNAGFLSDIGKPHVTEISIQLVFLVFANDEQVRPAVAIDVANRHTRADGSEQILLPLCPPDVGTAVVVYKAPNPRVVRIQFSEEPAFFLTWAFLQRGSQDS